MNVREYVRLQTGLLLRGVAAQVNRTARTGDAGAIHDLRVAVRRLRRCLRVFAQFYPGHSWKHLRRRLADLTESCGSVRDRDIAIGLLATAGVPEDAPLVRRLGEERRSAGRQLRRELRRWQDRRLRRHWRTRLEL
jgi:CHAD domain-containing protein